MRFSDFVILGTHDSCTSMGILSGTNILTDAYATQEVDLSRQFELGVRFFDIRINEDLDIIHGNNFFKFGSLSNTLKTLEEKTKEAKSFCIVSLKFDDGSLNDSNKEKLLALVSDYKAFNNSTQTTISGMYLLSRIDGLPFKHVSFKDDGYTQADDLYIQDCYKFTNVIQAEWRDKVGCIEKCDAENFEGIKINFTSFIKGSASTRLDPVDAIKDLFKLNPISAIPMNFVPNPLRCAVDVNKWLLDRAPSAFKSTIYAVDGVSKDLAEKFRKIPNYFS